LGDDYIAQVFADERMIYAATDKGLSISTDGGTTFTNYEYAENIIDNPTGVYVDGDKVYVSAYGYLAVSRTDIIPPSVTSITRAHPNPNSETSVDFTVTFSEDVKNVDLDDFALTRTGDVTGESLSGIEGSGNQYTITVQTGTGNGTLRLNVFDDDTIKDAEGNPLGGTGPINGDYLTGEVYTLDDTAPPNHDALNYARKITSLSYTDTVDTSYTTPSLTDDPDLSSCGIDQALATVWYTYEATANTAIALDTFGSDYDTFIAVWVDDGGMQLIACNNQSSANGGDQLAIQVKNGTTYYIEVGQP
jgi:hypothetical protein